MAKRSGSEGQNSTRPGPRPGLCQAQLVVKLTAAVPLPNMQCRLFEMPHSDSNDKYLPFVSRKCMRAVARGGVVGWGGGLEINRAWGGEWGRVGARCFFCPGEERAGTGVGGGWSRWASASAVVPCLCSSLSPLFPTASFVSPTLTPPLPSPPLPAPTEMTTLMKTTQKKPVKHGKKHAGRWTKKEHDLFLQGLKEHGREWKKVAEMIKSELLVLRLLVFVSSRPVSSPSFSPFLYLSLFLPPSHPPHPPSLLHSTHLGADPIPCAKVLCQGQEGAREQKHRPRRQLLEKGRRKSKEEERWEQQRRQRVATSERREQRQPQPG